MSQNTVNTGIVSNDGTGDTLRTAFRKINEDFTEVFSNIANNTANIANLVIVVDQADGSLLELTSISFDTANQAFGFANAQYTAMNAAFSMANGVNNMFYGAVANATAAYNFANSQIIKVNANYTVTNAAYATGNAAFLVTNSAYSTLNTAFDFANSISITTGQSFDAANAGITWALSGISNAAASFDKANAVYDYANVVSARLTSAYRAANSGYDVSNSSYDTTNTVYYKTNSAYTTVNAAYDCANTKVNTVNGIISGLLTVQGNSYVYGSSSIASGLHNIDSRGATFGKFVSVIANPSTSIGTLNFYDSTGATQYGYISSNVNALNIQSVTGNVTISTSFFNSNGFYANGNIYSTQNIYAYYSSDIRFKENVVNIDNALEKVKSINGVNFDWKDDWIKSQGGEDGYFIRKKDVGLIAQDVEKVLPEAVVRRKDDSLAVNYEKVVPLLIESIKQLSDEIDRLKNAIS